MQLVVGLGNPGDRYAQTRHNAGFWFADLLASRAGEAFSRQAKFHGELARFTLAGADLRVLKPETYMNRSGQAIAAVCRFFRIPPAGVLVVHDELDLPPGAVRLKLGGGAGGHNGLRDTISHIGAEFWRLRVGVGHPGHRDQVTDYVLSRARAEEESEIRDALDAAADALEVMLARGSEAAMQQLHSRGRKPRPYRKADDAAS